MTNIKVYCMDICTPVADPVVLDRRFKFAKGGGGGGGGGGWRIDLLIVPDNQIICYFLLIFLKILHEME